MFHCRNGARFPLDGTLGIQAKEFNLGFIRLENLVSHGLSPLGTVLFGKFQAGCHVPFTKERLLSVYSTIKV